MLCTLTGQGAVNRMYKKGGGGEMLLKAQKVQH